VRRLFAALGILATVFLGQTALANDVFVIGPGMLGHPGAVDPSVGYSALVLEEVLGFSEGAPAFEEAGAGQRHWEEAWFRLSQMPGG
jgi:hypothetical protein